MELKILVELPINSISMKKSIINFGRTLLLFCSIPFLSGCSDELSGDDNPGNGGGKVEPVTLSLDKATATTATFSGHLDIPSADIPYSQVTIYYSDAETFNMNDAKKKSATSFDENQDYTITLKELKYGAKYHYCMVADIKQAEKVYGEVLEFATDTVTMTLAYSGSEASNAHFKGKVTGISAEDNIKVGMYYSDDLEILTGTGPWRKMIEAKEIPADGTLSFEIPNLKIGTEYYFCYYVFGNDQTAYSEPQKFVVGENISVSVSVDESAITASTAVFNGKVDGVSSDDIENFTWYIEVSSNSFQDKYSYRIEDISEDGSFQVSAVWLDYGTKYYYRIRQEQKVLKPGYTDYHEYITTYGEEIKEFTTNKVTISFSVTSTFNTAIFTFKADGISEVDKGTIHLSCSPREDFRDGVDKENNFYLDSSEWDENNTIVLKQRGLIPGRQYYCKYQCRNVNSEVYTFKVGENTTVTSSESVSLNSVTISGKLTGWSQEDNGTFMIYCGQTSFKPMGDWTNSNYPHNDFENSYELTDINDDGSFSINISSLANSEHYFYNIFYVYSASNWIGNGSDRYYVFEENDFTTLDIYKDSFKDLDMASAVDLSSEGSANCYLVSNNGLYKFKTVKGNSNEYLKNVASCKILWESYGTSTAIQPYDLIKSVCYRDEYIAFQTSDYFKEGNAVVAATDAEGNIVWSWHIWMTDQPQGQVYYNDAGTMMDRNLGATTTVPGSVGALGLLYQWGRKDPFLGSSSISDAIEAKSTIVWPSAVDSSSEEQLDYAAVHPLTFIKSYNSHGDNTLWTTSETSKSINDPCPIGWRVPDGGSNGVWSKALGSSSYFTDSSLYDSTNKGINFSGKFGNDQNIWYPASGYRYYFDGSLTDVSNRGEYWSASHKSNYPYYLRFSYGGYVKPSLQDSPAFGKSVRCIKE